MQFILACDSLIFFVDKAYEINCILKYNHRKLKIFEKPTKHSNVKESIELSLDICINIHCAFCSGDKNDKINNQRTAISLEKRIQILNCLDQCKFSDIRNFFLCKFLYRSYHQTTININYKRITFIS
ncbi:hypothetical protein BpHYR1_001041 [Brachionus plicatilis]|uniref:Uncharacterized protein n=1 Tax=Brachionus plicatilis TaxID=10195 RepID=A0A3M7QCQ8_BRAPC|nr:hypothetical protein BpHYR1_001041 [Brachionus plicatilis]